MYLMTKMIEGEDAVEKHQHAIGDIQVVGGMVSDVFKAPNDVIGAIANRDGREWRQALDRRRTVLLQEFFDDGENIPCAAFCFAPSLQLDGIPARLEPQEWTHSEKRVAPNLFSTFDRFKQEGVGLSIGDGQKGGDRR